MVSQPASRLNLLDAIEGQQIVLAPLPHVTLGDLASAIGMLLVQQFVRSAFSRPGTDQSRHTYPLIVDELQVFIGKDGDSSDIQHAITQLRGLGIAGIYAHQTLDQLGALRDEMLTNSGSRLILRTQEPDASTYARLYAASGITANDIASQDANEHQYAVLQCDGERTGLFSMIMLPWPAPLPVPVQADDGPDWRTLIPPDSPDADADAELMRLIYKRHAQFANVVQSLADYTDEDWQYVLDRWEAIRAFHRQYILDHPGCIAIDEHITDPDSAVLAVRRAAKQRLDRQQWLSRLLVATPRVLAAAEYARIRRQIEPESGIAIAEHGRKRKPDLGQPIVIQTQQGDMLVAAPEPARAAPIVPIGFVSGATPKAGTVIGIPQIADARTTATVMETRGRRRAKDDIAEGFDDLTTPDESEEEIEQ